MGLTHWEGAPHGKIHKSDFDCLLKQIEPGSPLDSDKE